MKTAIKPFGLLTLSLMWINISLASGDVGLKRKSKDANSPYSEVTLPQLKFTVKLLAVDTNFGPHLYREYHHCYSRQSHRPHWNL